MAVIRLILGKLILFFMRIDEGAGRVQWMYESKDIIGYLEGRFVTG